MFKPNSNSGRGQQASSPQAAAPNNSSPQRLPQLWNPPTFEDIAQLLSLSQKHSGKSVELPFSVPGNDMLYQIRVVQPENSDPEWTFLSGTLTGLSTVWNIPCIDLQLVHSLVESESTGKDSIDLISSNSFNRSTTGNIAFPSAEIVEQSTSQTMSGAANLMQQASSSSNQEASIAREAPSVQVTGQQQASLEGDLEKLNLPAVLQSLALSKMTGRLGIASIFGGADIFLVEGNPVHATTGETKGDHAIIETLLWPSGKFKFIEQEKCADYTLTKRLETLLMEGFALLDQHNYLKNAGLNMDTYLKQAYRNLSEMQFEQLASRGAPVNMTMQKDFYLEIDSEVTLYELLLRMPLAKADWVPVVYNLVSVGLVRLSNQVQKKEVVELLDRDLDEQAIAAAIKPLSRLETDTFTYPVFQYFLKQEIARYGVDAKAFTLMVFDLLIERPSGQETMPLSAAKEALERVKGIKRDIDILGHFETFDYAIILPQTATRSAAIVAQRILERINAEPIASLGTNNGQINIAFGLAAFPQDGKSAGLLMAAAAEAKKHARKTSIAIVEYKAMT
ncbi:hypothetical protein BH11CYA1_BH11CYA1_43100 [soil metagenome]